MNLYKFRVDYFHGWKVVNIKTHGTDCGNMVLQSGETCLNVFFNLHGDTHWTGNNVTVDHVESCKPEVFQA